MKPYNMGKILAELQDLQPKLKGKALDIVAAGEHLSGGTVREYLKGKIKSPAVAEAIVKRGKAVLKANNSLAA